MKSVLFVAATAALCLTGTSKAEPVSISSIGLELTCEKSPKFSLEYDLLQAGTEQPTLEMQIKLPVRNIPFVLLQSGKYLGEVQFSVQVSDKKKNPVIQPQVWSKEFETANLAVTQSSELYDPKFGFRLKPGEYHVMITLQDKKNPTCGELVEIEISTKEGVTAGGRAKLALHIAPDGSKAPKGQVWKEIIDVLSCLYPKKAVEPLKKAKNESDRDAEWKQFWKEKVGDPDPQTTANEVLETLIDRMEYAKENYGFPDYGIRSDRARILYRLGPADRIDGGDDDGYNREVDRGELSPRYQGQSLLQVWMYTSQTRPFVFEKVREFSPWKLIEPWASACN
jgi:GWxTD domain-containing protein